MSFLSHLNCGHSYMDKRHHNIQTNPVVIILVSSLQCMWKLLQNSHLYTYRNVPEPTSGGQIQGRFGPILLYYGLFTDTLRLKLALLDIDILVMIAMCVFHTLFDLIKTLGFYPIVFVACPPSCALISPKIDLQRLQAR